MWFKFFETIHPLTVISVRDTLLDSFVAVRTLPIKITKSYAFLWIKRKEKKCLLSDELNIIVHCILSGRLLDMSDNPNVPYSLFSVWQMIGGVLVAFVVPILKRYTRRDLITKETACDGQAGADEPEAFSNLTDLSPIAEAQPLKEAVAKEDETVA